MANSRRRMSLAVALALVAGIVLAPARTVRAGAEDWNAANIEWMDYAAGLAAAKKSGRPICLIFYTSWCPHCANYSKVFSDPEVAKKAKSFVMIRLDKDKNQPVSAKYNPDGEYIPRTYFLSADGTLDASLTAPRTEYKYFYDEKDPASILAGMERALQKLK